MHILNVCLFYVFLTKQLRKKRKKKKKNKIKIVFPTQTIVHHRCTRQSKRKPKKVVTPNCFRSWNSMCKLTVFSIRIRSFRFYRQILIGSIKMRKWSKQCSLFQWLTTTETFFFFEFSNNTLLSHHKCSLCACDAPLFAPRTDFEFELCIYLKFVSIQIDCLCCFIFCFRFVFI